MNNYKILIIDDNEDLADAMKDLMQVDDHDAVAVYTGEDGISTIKQEEGNFDLVFLDVKLPGKNGIEVYHHVKELYPNIKIIIMTAFRMKELIEESSKQKDIHIIPSSAALEEMEGNLENILTSHSTFLEISPGANIDQLLASAQNKGLTVEIVKDKLPETIPKTFNSAELIIIDNKKTLVENLKIYLLRGANRLTCPIVHVSRLIVEAKKESLSDYLARTGCLLKPFDLLGIIEIVTNITEKRNGT